MRCDVARFVYERPRCHPPLRLTISRPTEPFLLAHFYDPDAPFREHRVVLPVDTSLSGLRKFPRAVTLDVSAQLRKQVDRIQAIKLADLDNGDIPAEKPIDLGMVCSMSIPIITICALVPPMIIVSPRWTLCSSGSRCSRSASRGRRAMTTPTDSTQALLFGQGIAFPPRVGADGRFEWAIGHRGIRDSIRIVLTTEPGEWSSAAAEFFAAGLRSFLFEPNTPATHRLMEERIGHAIRRWEPRLALDLGRGAAPSR